MSVTAEPVVAPNSTGVSFEPLLQVVADAATSGGWSVSTSDCGRPALSAARAAACGEVRVHLTADGSGWPDLWAERTPGDLRFDQGADGWIAFIPFRDGEMIGPTVPLSEELIRAAFDWHLRNADADLESVATFDAFAEAVGL